MSSNREDKQSGNGSQQGPKLVSGGYAAWRADMDVFLETRAGAKRVHTKAMTDALWNTIYTEHLALEDGDDDDILEWKAAQLQVVASTTASAASTKSASAASTPKKTISASSSASSTASAASAAAPSAAALTADEKKKNEKLAAMVTRSIHVYGIIYAAMTPELKQEATHIPFGFAFGLWHWLETTFQSTEADSVGQLYKQWSQLRQTEGEKFATFRARVDSLKMLLERAKEKISGRMYIHTLLDRLLPLYEPVVLSLENSEALKDAENVAWSDVAAKMAKRERTDEQRMDSLDGANASAVMAMRGDSRSSKPSYAATAGGGMSSGRGRDRDRPMSEVKCYNCNEFGHVAHKCTKPMTEESKNRQAEYAKKQAAFWLAKSKAPAQASKPATSTRAETMSVVKVDNSFEALSTDDDLDSGSDKDCDGDAETSTVYALPTATGTGVSWGIDSMASVHISGDKRHFNSIVDCKPMHVKVANGRSMTVTQQGTVSLQVTAKDGLPVAFTVKNVYHHPSFSNLLSWNKMRRDGCSMKCPPGEGTTIITSPAGFEFCLSTVGDLSVLHTAEPSQTERISSVEPNAAPSIDTVDKLIRVHERLGHMGFDRMICTIKTGATLGVGTLNLSNPLLADARRRIMECTSCLQGKGHRTAFGHRGLDKGQSKGEVLHMDTFHMPLEEGDRKWMEYGIVVKDAFTKYTWFAHVDTKDKIPAQVICIVRQAQTQGECTVKRLHADGGSEFNNATIKAFCVAQGIEFHFSPARTPQLNGVAERTVRTIKEAVSTHMNHAKLTERY